MREVRRTFEHLVIILVAVVLVLAIIFAIPAVRSWVFENAPAAVVKVAGSGATSSLAVGVNPKLLANAVNDKDTRDSIIALWKKSLPQMQPDALADMANQLMADPNTAAFIVNVIAETDPDKMAELYNSLVGDPAMADYWTAVFSRMDAKGMANLSNALMANEATATLVNNLIKYADNEATAKLLNALLGDEETANKFIEFTNYLKADAVGNFVNGVMADAQVDGSKLADFINTLVESSDTQKVAALAEKIMNSDATLSQLDKFMSALDKNSLGYFTFQMLAHEGTSRFINGALGQISPEHQAYALDVLGRFLQPYQEVNGGFDWQSIKGLYQDATFNWDAVKDKFNWEVGSGLYPALMGNRSQNDALFDYTWIEFQIDKVFAGGMSVGQYMGQKTQQYIQTAIRMQAANIIAQPWFASWWNQWFPTIPASSLDPDAIAKTIGSIVTDQLGYRLGELGGITIEDMFEEATYYVRLGDSSIGVVPFWDMPFWQDSSTHSDPWGVISYVPPSVDRTSTIYGPNDYLFKRDANGNAILAPGWTSASG